MYVVERHDEDGCDVTDVKKTKPDGLDLRCAMPTSDGTNTGYKYSVQSTHTEYRIIVDKCQAMNILRALRLPMFILS